MSAALPGDAASGGDVTLADIVAARERIAGGVERTGCPYSPALSRLTGCEVFVKLEYQQRTGSFKERGARNALLQLSPEARAGGVHGNKGADAALAALELLDLFDRALPTDEDEA